MRSRSRPRFYCNLHPHFLSVFHYLGIHLLEDFEGFCARLGGIIRHQNCEIDFPAMPRNSAQILPEGRKGIGTGVLVGRQQTASACV